MLRHSVIIICLYFVVCQDFGSKETPCSWDGVPGRCVSVFNCLSSIKNIGEMKYPPVCSYEGKTPIICCTDCELVNDTRLYILNPTFGFLNKTGTNKARDKCLEYIHTLDYPCKKDLLPTTYTTELDPIRNCTNEVEFDPDVDEDFALGGRDAESEEYSHMALLGYGDDIDKASWLCGGSVISEKFILTAAHCIFAPELGSVKYIALGILKRSDPIELWQRYNVKNAIRHPDYKPPSKYHDIALLESDKEIAFSSKVLPACLHTDSRFDPYAYATGWGALGHRKNLADVLQSVGLHKFTEEECSRYYPTHRHLLKGYNHTTQMCYGDRRDRTIPTDTCEGDSGGPLQSNDHEICVYTILGVTSYGRPCGQSGGSGMYTRVSHYVPWIESIVWPSSI